MNETRELNDPSADGSNWQTFSSSDQNYGSYSSSTVATAPFSMSPEDDSVFLNNDNSYLNSPTNIPRPRLLERTFEMERAVTPEGNFLRDNSFLNSPANIRPRLMERTFEIENAAPQESSFQDNSYLNSPTNIRPRLMERTFEMERAVTPEGSFLRDNSYLNSPTNIRPRLMERTFEIENAAPQESSFQDNSYLNSPTNIRPRLMERTFEIENAAPQESSFQNSTGSSMGPYSSRTDGTGSSMGQYSSRMDGTSSSMGQHSSRMDGTGSSMGQQSSWVDTGGGSSGQYSSRSDKTDDSFANNSWVELEHDINGLMLQELEDLESKTPEKQFEFFKSWFQISYGRSLLFEHFTSTIKYLLMEHNPKMTLKNYLPGTLLVWLQKCLSKYRDEIIKSANDFLEVNKGMELWAVKEDEVHEHQMATEEIIEGYRNRLNSATERAINAREQVAGLQTQLSQSLAHIDELDRTAALKDKSSLLQSLKSEDKELSSVINESRRTSDRSFSEELERQLRSKIAMCSSLEEEISIANHCNQQLWDGLREEKQNSAVLEANLTSSIEECAHKSQLLSTVAEELVSTFEKSLSHSLSVASQSSMNDSRATVEGWKNELQQCINEKEDSLKLLDRKLTNVMIKENDMKNKVRAKEDVIYGLELEYEIKANLHTKHQADLENKELEISELYDELHHTQTAIDQMIEELHQKNKILSSLREELSKVTGELLSLEKVRIASGCGPNASLNRMYGQSFKLQTLVASSVTDAGKFFASMDLPKVRNISPIQLNLSSQRHLASLSRSGIPLYLKRRFTKTVMIRHPNKNEALEFKIHVLPSASGEHLKCDLQLNDNASKAPNFLTSSFKNQPLIQPTLNKSKTTTPLPLPFQDKSSSDYSGISSNYSRSTTSTPSASKNYGNRPSTPRRAMPSPNRAQSPYPNRSQLTPSTPINPGRSKIPSFFNRRNLTQLNSPPSITSPPHSQTR